MRFFKKLVKQIEEKAKKIGHEVERVAHQAEKHVIRPIAKEIAATGIHVSTPFPPQNRPS